MEKNIMTKAEFAEFMNCSVKTIEKFMSEGMPVLRPNSGSRSFVRIDLLSALEWMKAKTESNKKESE